MVDEQTIIDQYYDLYGRDTAERLFSLRQRCYPTPFPKGDPRHKTADEVFVTRAKRDGFDEQAVYAFMELP